MSEGDGTRDKMDTSGPPHIEDGESIQESGNAPGSEPQPKEDDAPDADFQANHRAKDKSKAAEESKHDGDMGSEGAGKGKQLENDVSKEASEVKDIPEGAGKITNGIKLALPQSDHVRQNEMDPPKGSGTEANPNTNTYTEVGNDYQEPVISPIKSMDDAKTSLVKSTGPGENQDSKPATLPSAPQLSESADSSDSEPEPETISLSVSPSVASLIHRRSGELGGGGYLDHLLDQYGPALDPDTEENHPEPIDEWIPKIGLDAYNKSIEIDVGSQVVVVNLSDFYKPRDPSRLYGGAPVQQQQFGAAPPASGLDLLAATATEGLTAGGEREQSTEKQKFTCCICPATWPTQMALRLHCATSHRLQPCVCVRCGLSFLTQRKLDRHPCEEKEREEREERERKRREEEEAPKVPPVVIRPPVMPQRVRRLEDTSSSESDSGSDSEPPRRSPAPAAFRSPPPPAARSRPPPPLPPPPARSRPPPPPPSPSQRSPQRSSSSKPAGKKEAYVCRVCHSKFRDPKAVLSHLKEFHPEHARKAWNKFQENLRSREPHSSSGASSSGSTDYDRKVPPMRLKLARVESSPRGRGRARGRGRGRPPASGRGRGRPPATSATATSYPASPPPTGPPTPGFVTCGVCGGTKYYQHTSQCRQDGSYACEVCRRFARHHSAQRAVQCQLGLGRCHIPAVAPRNATDSRCLACWLKRCLNAFNMPYDRHDKLRMCLPTSLRESVPVAADKQNRQAGHCELDTLLTERW